MSTVSYKEAAPIDCRECRSGFPASLLACPRCGWLLHGDQLQELAATAATAETEKRYGDALLAWRQALQLLPAQSKQHRRIADKCAYLSSMTDDAPSAPIVAGGAAASSSEHGTGAGKKLIGGLGGIALLIWKFKWLGTFILTKAKFLFAGLKSGGTFFSMAAAFGVYWTVWGWPFALGIVLAIYVHEMGHVAALRRYGIAASAPMFIPGLGAFIRLKERLTSPREEARVGLAGPEWGLGATVVGFAVYWATGAAIWGAIGKFSAFINLFNLLPVWQLDGSRGLSALSQSQRRLLAAVVGGAWFFTGEGMLVLIALVTLLRAFGKEDPTPQWSIFWRFSFLVVALSVLSTFELPAFEELMAAR